MNRLKTIRKKLGASQIDVANAIGISQQAYARYENEQREPKLETWQKLADYFHVSIGYIQGLYDKNETETDKYLIDSIQQLSFEKSDKEKITDIIFTLNERIEDLESKLNQMQHLEEYGYDRNDY
ncbi:helix-turn-helix domain-containing protein [Weissella sagaensis]|uniref:Helix-turn-helix domain-containing protein n=1 Tax=Weissella sagaensis TaxID=2559928 RepID=A0ABW1RT89_9LACO|nr:helix-turn-helix transcriptional regulator [Weissella sagaensis]